MSSHSVGASSYSVAVIDIGSNSIKVLVAKREASGDLTSLKMSTMEARISAGISRAEPRISAEGISRGVSAIAHLLTAIAPYAVDRTILVATSAVRDAQNGTEFTTEVLKQTGHPVQIISGEEEANYIGRGLTCDPALRSLRDFYLFDLGGGSLECLRFLDRKIDCAMSLPLGCVRLTERCVKNPGQPFTLAECREISALTRDALMGSGFAFSLSGGAVAVGTGGTMTTARAVLAGLRGQSFEASAARLSITELQELFASVAESDLETRIRMPNMPAARADVFPTALATMLALAEYGGVTAYQTSLFNLRWGVADEALH